MTKVKNDYTINEIIDLTKEYLINLKDDNYIIEAYKYIENLFPDNIKTTILNVLSILTTVYADEETMAAYILYRLFENQKIKPEIETKFSKTIAKLSFGIYKLNKITLSTENDYLVEYYKKVIVGMSEDVRMIIITLSERVELMRRLANDSSIPAKKTAKETLEIFAPIAHHLGVYKLKSELEDLSLRYLKPDVFYDIKTKLNSTKIGRDNTINEMMNSVSEILTEHNIKFEIKGRSKSIYSIYNKLDKGRKWSDIYDLLALRILVEDESTCYLVLGLIHSKFKPIPKRFKDFIAMPKQNGYQSLHTTVFGLDNLLFEIQIRTFEMNEVAENGLAAHWSYKEHRDAVNISSTDAKLDFFKQVIDMNHDEISPSIKNLVKEETNDDNIYVFTPKGDVIELPKGSTPVDFAYRVHSKIGDSMVGSIVNNQIVPLNYILQDNDVVKIQTSKQSSGPKEGWLKFVKLTTTKNKIKSFFVKNRKEELIIIGKNILDKELKKSKIVQSEFYQEENIKKILKESRFKTQEELYIELATNKISPKTIINIIYELPEEIKIKKIINSKEIDINIEGLNDIRVNISSCCHPIPGDEIIGYITKNNGISIHRKDCLNTTNLNTRIIEARWNDKTKNYYLTTIIITQSSNQDHLGDILNKITNRNIRIDTVRTQVINNLSVYKINLYVLSKEILDKLIMDLTKIRYVKDVTRK